MLCCAVLCCAVLCCAVLCCAVLCCAVLCCAVLCCTVLCCTVLYYTVLYCTTLHVLCSNHSMSVDKHITRSVSLLQQSNHKNLRKMRKSVWRRRRLTQKLKESTNRYINCTRRTYSYTCTAILFIIYIHTVTIS